MKKTIGLGLPKSGQEMDIWIQEVKTAHKEMEQMASN